MFQERSGVIQRYDQNRQIGIIVCEEVNGVADRFFFHGSNVLYGPAVPKPGQTCQFKLNPDHKVRPGWLKKAQAIRIAEPTTAQLVQSILSQREVR